MGWNRSGIQERKGMKTGADWAVSLLRRERKREEAKIVCGSPSAYDVPVQESPRRTVLAGMVGEGPGWCIPSLEGGSC